MGGSMVIYEFSKIRDVRLKVSDGLIYWFPIHPKRLGNATEKIDFRVDYLLDRFNVYHAPSFGSTRRKYKDTFGILELM